MAEDHIAGTGVGPDLPGSRWAVFSDGCASFMRRFEIDRAVVYLIVARLLQVASFPITAVLIVHSLTAEVQGFYYTFGSVLALQMFVELGFVFVILNVASHEWSYLRLTPAGSIEGDPKALSRLVSLGRLVFKWYAAAAALFTIGAAVGGWYFFSHSAPSSKVHWQWPLFALIAVSGLLLWTLPFNALLEGCNQVANINKLRVSQTALESLALWATLLLGGGLWAAVAAVSAKVVRDFYLLFVQYRNFFRPFVSLSPQWRISWKHEIWPMQWRLAVAGIAAYFGSSLYNPVMFRYHGAATAGQMGMTLQVILGMQLVPMAWVLTKVPRYGMLIARRDYEELDRLWLRNSTISVCVAASWAVLVLCAVVSLRAFHLRIAERLLPPFPTALLLIGAILMQIVQCLVAYLRAHKQEPILAANVTMALLAGVMVWALGRWIGPTGAAFANLIQMILTLGWIYTIWSECRKRWHSDVDGAV